MPSSDARQIAYRKSHTRLTSWLVWLFCHWTKTLMKVFVMQVEISVCSLWMHIRSLWMAIQRLRTAVHNLRTEILPSLLKTLIMVLG